jgi:hypothetical protein
MRVSTMKMSLASETSMDKKMEYAIIKKFILDIKMKMKLMIEIVRNKGLF